MIRQGINAAKIKSHLVVEYLWTQFPEWKQSFRTLGFKDEAMYSLLICDKFNDLSHDFLNWCIDSMIWMEWAQKNHQGEPIGGSGLIYHFFMEDNIEWQDFVPIYDVALIEKAWGEPNQDCDHLPVRHYKQFSLPMNCIAEYKEKYFLTLHCIFANGKATLQNAYFEWSVEQVLFIEKLLEKALPIWDFEKDLASDESLSPMMKFYETETNMLTTISQFESQADELQKRLENREFNSLGPFNIMVETLEINDHTILHLQTSKPCAWPVEGIIIYVHQVDGIVELLLQATFAKEQVILKKGQAIVWPHFYFHQFLFRNNSWAKITIVHILKWNWVTPKKCGFYPFIRDEYVALFLKWLNAHFTKFVNNTFQEFSLQFILPKLYMWEMTAWKKSIINPTNRSCFTLL